eukprot:scaffold1564_cov389-Prasinococcus_capsulatus_cf.AAC.23
MVPVAAGSYFCHSIVNSVICLGAMGACMAGTVSQKGRVWVSSVQMYNRFAQQSECDILQDGGHEQVRKDVGTENTEADEEEPASNGKATVFHLRVWIHCLSPTICPRAVRFLGDDDTT